jgi:hypothetical protein
LLAARRQSEATLLGVYLFCFVFDANTNTLTYEAIPLTQLANPALLPTELLVRLLDPLAVRHCAAVLEKLGDSVTNQQEPPFLDRRMRRIMLRGSGIGLAQLLFVIKSDGKTKELWTPQRATEVAGI